MQVEDESCSMHGEHWWCAGLQESLVSCCVGEGT